MGLASSSSLLAYPPRGRFLGAGLDDDSVGVCVIGAVSSHDEVNVARGGRGGEVVKEGFPTSVLVAGRYIIMYAVIYLDI